MALKRREKIKEEVIIKDFETTDKGIVDLLASKGFQPKHVSGPLGERTSKLYIFDSKAREVLNGK